MKLATRLSLFFQVLLALVLAGSSATLYLLARSYLHGQTEERLRAALNTLVAAVEFKPNGVEWEPAERALTFRLGAAEEPVVWLISDNEGRVVDRSGPAATDAFLAEATKRVERGKASTARLDWQGQRWQVTQRWLEPRVASGGRQPPDAASGGRQPPDVASGGRQPPFIASGVTSAPRAAAGGREPPETKYATLAITTGISLQAVHATLRSLAWALAAVSLAVWFLALIVGRAVCQRALRPVTLLAASARGMNAADLEGRLPVAATGDELENLSRSFNGLLDRLHESFERQRRFTGDASHQLRTPLTALLGQIEVALRRERGPEEYRQVLVSVQKQGMHLRRIVESLLFLARADAEVRLPDREIVSLDDWLARHLESWSGHPRLSDIRLERGDDLPLDVAVQPVLLGELVNILLDNACKYSDPGTPITLRAARQDGNVLLSVADRGSGIGREDLPHLGEPFFRSADARRRGVAGVGLGLAIAHRLAEAQAGSLVVASEKGTGSRFTVSLPSSKHPGPFPWLPPAPRQ